MKTSCEQNDEDDIFLYPKFGSETRFANYAVLIYTQIRTDWPGIIQRLEEIILNDETGSHSQKAKREAAIDLSNDMNNFQFALQVSSLQDVYSKYSELVCCLQVMSSTVFDIIGLH